MMRRKLGIEMSIGTAVHVPSAPQDLEWLFSAAGVMVAPRLNAGMALKTLLPIDSSVDENARTRQTTRG